MKTWVIFLVFGSVVSGCGQYRHRVVNAGDTLLYAVSVQSAEVEFGHGYLPSGATKAYSGSMRIVKNPPPVVSWKNEDRGELIRRIVALPRSQGRGSEVVFEIMADGSVKALVR